MGVKYVEIKKPKAKYVGLATVESVARMQLAGICFIVLMHSFN